MTIATPDTDTGRSMSQLPAPCNGTTPRPTGRFSLDLIGASALLLAIAGLGGTLFLFRTPPSALQATEGVSLALSASPIRDQWYLEWTGASDRRSGRTARLGSEGSLVPGPGQREYRARWRRTRP